MTASGTTVADILSTVSPVDIGASGIVVVIVVMVLTGKLVPLVHHRQVVTERDQWRRAHEVSEEARHMLQSQVAELLEHNRLTNDILHKLPTPDDRRDEPV